MPGTTRLSDRLKALRPAPIEDEAQINATTRSIAERLANLIPADVRVDTAPAAPAGRLSGRLDQRLAAAPAVVPESPSHPVPRLSDRYRGLQPAAQPQPAAETAPPPAGPLFRRFQEIQDALPAPVTITVPFGEWLPDLAALGNPGLTQVKNVVPIANGYRPFPAFAQYSSSALDARCQGAFVANDTAGNTVLLAGDVSKLYRLVTTTWTDSSAVGGYAAGADDSWEFAQFETTVIAGQIGNAIQSMTISGSVFATLMASTLKPTARHLAVVRNFLVLGNTSDTTDGAQPWRVWWSGINDPTDLSPAASTQCDFEDLPEGGWVQRIVGGAEYGLVFQERQITRMTYVGAPLIWQLDPIERGRGTPIPNSVVGHGRMVFYVSEEGFFMTDGVTSVPIGQNKVDRTFWNEFDVANFGRMSSAIDQKNKLVMWCFPGAGSTGGEPNTLYIYNWTDQKWSRVDAAVQFVAKLSSQGYTLDGLDAVNSNIDLLTPSLDSKQWQGGAQQIAAFGTDHRLYFLTAGNMAATIETGEFQLAPNHRSKIFNIRPLVDGSSVVAELTSRIRLADAFSYSASATMDAEGNCPLIDEGRYHRVKISISSSTSWNHALGIEVTGSPQGVT